MRFKTVLLGCAAMIASAAVAVPAAQAGFAAIAAGPGGVGYAESGYGSMESARQAAVRACRNGGGGSCSVSTAENDGWYFAAGYCDGTPYTAATPQGYDRLVRIIEMKGAADGNYNCYIEYWF